LFESEFFGHVKGAFTGALKDRAGRFEAADGGTLFLDEVGEIPPPLQGKLLRTLQEGQFERVGEERTREVDVRVIAATNRNLEAEVARGQFRHDLYYRLNVFPIEIAPLRQRKEDIAPLAALFLKRAAGKLNRAGMRLSQANHLNLQEYDWPGNVRELQNVIERAVIVSRDNRLNFDLKIGNGDIKAALKRCSGRIYGPKGAARLLGLPPTTLNARIKSIGIKKKTFNG
jgi:transcriptional regulator with GAF, ATPase, and Fis domain